jgi:hypothetical protein
MLKPPASRSCNSNTPEESYCPPPLCSVLLSAPIPSLAFSIVYGLWALTLGGKGRLDNLKVANTGEQTNVVQERVDIVATRYIILFDRPA